MNGNVLVLGEAHGLSEALEFLLLGRANVRHAHTADDTEGLDVDVVVVTGPGVAEHIRAVRVHPRLDAVPTVALSADGEHITAPHGGWVVDTRRLDVLDDLTERVSWLLARTCHPSARGAHSRAGTAA